MYSKNIVELSSYNYNVRFILLFILSAFISDIHFYFIHRMMHPWRWKLFHQNMYKYDP
eukprot:UN11225